MSRRRHSARIRSSSAGSGVTASCSAPRAAKTSVEEPAPVSSVAIPGRTFSSSQASAAQARPQYSSPAPCRPGGEARRSSVRRVKATQYHRRGMAARRALITGIGGQDGSLLAELLLAEGYEVFGVVRRAPGSYENLAAIRERIELIQADLLDQLSLVKALEECRPQEVYNLASVSFVPA